MKIRTKKTVSFEEWEDIGVLESETAVDQQRGKLEFMCFEVIPWKEGEWTTEEAQQFKKEKIRRGRKVGERMGSALKQNIGYNCT